MTLLREGQADDVGAFDLKRDLLASLPSSVVLNALPNVVTLLAIDGTVLDISTGEIPALVPPLAIVGRHVTDLFPHDVATGLLEAVRETVTGNHQVHHQYTFTSPEGTLQYRETLLTPIDEGRVLAVGRNVELAPIRKIGERIVAELTRELAVETLTDHRAAVTEALGKVAEYLGASLALVVEPAENDRFDIRYRWRSTRAGDAPFGDQVPINAIPLLGEALELDEPVLIQHPPVDQWGETIYAAALVPSKPAAVDHGLILFGFTEPPHLLTDVRLDAVASIGSVVMASLTRVRAEDRSRVVDAQLETALRHDTLTGLPNRAALHNQIDTLLAERTSVKRVGVLFIDIDYFKRVNDSLGHAAGDVALSTVSKRLVRLVGTHGTVARFAGDEFVVVLEIERGISECLEMADRIRETVAEPVLVGTGVLHLTASIGITTSEPHPGSEAPSEESLLRDADTALHHAKLGGRNMHVVFDTTLREALVNRIELEQALHTALEVGELRMHYQPVLDLATGCTVASEALVRWDRPGHGMVSPGLFVPIAEQSGIINELGNWVLHEATREAAAWHQSHGLGVAINVSARQLTHPGLVGAVLSALDESGLPGEALSLELTETAYTSASTTTVHALQAIRERGIHVVLDDFGSGYCSIERVRRFPIDAIKIDRSCVLALRGSQRDADIVRVMIDLAHALGVPVTAEGIELDEEHDALVALGCDHGQGYLYSHPLPPEEFASNLTPNQ